MNATRLLPLLLALSPIVACSGETAPTFTDPVAALDQGDEARSAGDPDLAAAAYEYAATNGSAEQKTDALVGLFELEVEGGQAEAAVAAFGRLCTNATPSEEDLVHYANLCVTERLVEAGNAVVNYAVANNEGIAATLARPLAALDRLEKEGPGADLSDLGYVGN